ncbi:MAG: lipopolysaccharide transport periplasmic protein LptA [Gammaproteobacteria bacterium]|nr:MAG: lipopolysaccharide transport periplasmic protein LptA [Gammaproteobacteria bacterium]
MRRLEYLLMALLLLSNPLALALSSDKDQPVELAADSVDLDEAKQVSVYKGDVDLRQGSMRLRADQVTVQHQGRKPDRLIAVGRPVRFEQRTGKGKKVKARARRAEYEVNSEVLTLIGDAVLTQDGDTLKSDRIVYDRVRHKVKAGAAAKGKKRVRITIQPGK